MTTTQPSFDHGLVLAHKLVSLLRDSSFLPEIFPPLFAGGVAEGTLHALMLSGLILVGKHLGFSPVTDAPLFDRLDTFLTGDRAKRPDALWFSRQDWQVRCLGEFERYTPHSLVPKAKNLLVMGKELKKSLWLAVLNYWTYVSIAESMLEDPRQVFEKGFLYGTGVYFPPLSCPVLVLETLVMASNNQVVVHGIIPRLLVMGGENKPYLVKQFMLRE